MLKALIQFLIFMMLLLLCACGSSRKASLSSSVSSRNAATMRADLSSVMSHASVSELLQFSEDMDISVIEYDTSLPADSATGKPPVKKQTVVRKRTDTSKQSSQAQSQHSESVSEMSAHVESADSIVSAVSKERQETTVPRQIGGVVWALCALLFLFMLFYLIRFLRKTMVRSPGRDIFS